MKRYVIVVILAVLIGVPIAGAAANSVPGLTPPSAGGPPDHCGNANRVAQHVTGTRWVPIVLVHGITGSPAVWSEPQKVSMEDQLGSIPGTAVYAFDYSHDSLQWVTDSHIGDALASTIDCLARASGNKVIVVAHSMGGLATQEAQDPKHHPHVGSEIGTVVTLGTPTDGSELELVARGYEVGAADVVLFGLIKYCGNLGQRDPLHEKCSVVSSIDTAAGRAMTPGSPELAKLPAWTRGIARHRIAGDIQYTVSMFHRRATVDLGDVMMSVTSATANGTDSPDIIKCTNTLGYRNVFSIPCYHGNEPSGPQFILAAYHHVNDAASQELATGIPTLGQPWGFGHKDQTGYGQVQPPRIYNGGNPTGVVDQVHWSAWGNAQATATGTALYVGPGQYDAEGTDEPASVAAFNLGVCNGQYMYQAIEWFFPQHGEKFNPHSYINICSGDYIGVDATTPEAGGWANTHLTITPTSLGAVKVGVNVSDAGFAAGYLFDQIGDGMTYPSILPTGWPHDYVGINGPNNTVTCVGSEYSGTQRSSPQTVSTPEGVALGASTQQLLAIYGTHAKYVPAPPYGLSTNAGYVVTEPDGNLAFTIKDNTVVGIAGGDTTLNPNTCPG